MLLVTGRCVKAGRGFWLEISEISCRSRFRVGGLGRCLAKTTRRARQKLGGRDRPQVLAQAISRNVPTDLVKSSDRVNRGSPPSPRSCGFMKYPATAPPGENTDGRPPSELGDMNAVSSPRGIARREDRISHCVVALRLTGTRPVVRTIDWLGRNPQSKTTHPHSSTGCTGSSSYPRAARPPG